ncbi:hsp70-binding protein 1-like [Saccoglossus kowalevskii]|uniref:Hsp70-binding protein 1-like n=1 Tax=Saccoglossus kowalevskii TaxID=10224 RepID=A0ABM0GTC3_SACKO|nr:PREDICTED: hsp70-binding protein 1-like [Saccoglossus kowalevskii]
MASSGSGDDRHPTEGSGADPKKLQDVLKLAIENTPSNTAAASDQRDLSEERQQWLHNALSDMYRDEVKEMQQYLSIMKEKIESDGDEELEQMEIMLENIQDICESMDNARDFDKIGGLPTLKQCLVHSHSGVRWRAAALVATMAQNNPYCQQVLLEGEFLSVLLEMLDSDANDTVKVKAIYAVSCMVRNCSNALDDFTKKDGFSVLIRALQSGIEKLQIKAAFMLNAIILEKETIKDDLYSMGYVQQLVGLLQTSHNASHEHIISILCNLVTGHPRCLQECQQPGLNLEQTLKLKIEDVQGKEEYLEELEYTKQLLSLCFPTEIDNSASTDR